MTSLVLLLAGCATQTSALLGDTGLPRRVELAATPFFPQERYQCGPAALAMALGAAGIAAEPEALVAQVYLPQREGSLQVEMLAAGRRNGAFSMTIPPRLGALLAEVAAGNPVLVLQNLSLPWVPLWHYALVVGYDLDKAEILLRSGVTPRLVMPLSTFEHTWQRSKAWGMVALPPGRLPRTAEEAPTVAAAIAFEQSNAPAAARRIYAAALERWPDNLALLLGLGYNAYAAGDVAAAADAFGRAVEVHPQSVPALNDFAFALSALGRHSEARAAAQKALALGGPWQDAVRDTLQRIDAAARAR
ncbi:MAG: PA2778 family cysteine peptidase [Rhodocyclales bacterium]|nr:PA2778 family cysteine peptidase [Rhodocyclales bacterium]